MAVTQTSGGPTTQAGIYFQNCITALRLAHMLTQDEFANADGTSLGRIIRVRAEAPTPVDDTVVEYSSGRTEYIQAKMNIQPSGPTWVKLWKHFYDQYHSQTFKQAGGGDVITLAVRWSDRMSALENLFARANESETVKEWLEQLNEEQKLLKSKIEVALTGSGRKLEEEAMLRFCRSISVWQSNFEGDPRKTDTFAVVINRTLRGTVAPAENAFSALMALVGERAQQKGSWDYEKLKTQLKANGVKTYANPPKLRTTGRKHSGKGKRGKEGSIDIMNRVTAYGSKFGDIVGEAITGDGVNSDRVSAPKIRILNDTVLRDVETGDITGRKR